MTQILVPNPGAPLIHQEVLNIPFVNPGEWSPIVLGTPVPVQAGQPYTFLIDGGLILMLGNYPQPGLDSDLGPVLDYAFQTYVRPPPQSDLDGDGVGDVCDPCSNPRGIAGRYVFYNNSFYDSAASACNTLVGQTCGDNTAIATDKAALNPGGTATTANYISFNKSINGLMIDVTPGGGCSPLPAGPLAASNFEFKIANSANINSYVAAAAPLSFDVTPGGGTGGSDRIVIIWANNAIPNTRWLRTVVKSNANGGSIDLAADNVFYYGVAIGESMTPSATRAIVNSTDEIDARNHPHNSLPANRVPVATNSTYAVANAPDAKYDYDKSSTVSSTDEIIARNNPTNSLNGLLLMNPAP